MATAETVPMAETKPAARTRRVAQHGLIKEIVRPPEIHATHLTLGLDQSPEICQVQAILIRAQDAPDVVVVPCPRTAPATRLQHPAMLKTGTPAKPEKSRSSENR